MYALKIGGKVVDYYERLEDAQHDGDYYTYISPVDGEIINESGERIEKIHSGYDPGEKLSSKAEG